jgi:ATP-dependent DNA helicase RecQ
MVDDAHSIGERGSDFRPDCLRLGPVIGAVGRPAVLALTATVNPAVREEIVARLGMRNARVIVKGSDRPNLWLAVHTFPTEQAKREALLAEMEQAGKPGIVYASRQRHAEEITRELTADPDRLSDLAVLPRRGDRARVERRPGPS